jgi:hypothetical protein
MRVRPPASSRVAMERVRQRFEQWRRTRTPGRSPIPASLWAAAVTLARHHGVYVTSRLLRLDYGALKRRLSPAGDRESAAPATSPPTLIELRPAPGLCPPCVIEIESACGGRMRVQVPQITVSDLVALTRGVWRDGGSPR